MNDGQDFDKYSLWSKANDRQYSFRPDNFYYSIGKYSGEFFLKNDTLIPTEFIPITGTLFKLRSLVVTPEGNEYVFNASETTGLTSSHIKQPKYVSTYYIKSIVSPNRTDTIYLSTEWCIQHHNILFLRRLFQDKQERSRLWY